MTIRLSCIGIFLAALVAACNTSQVASISPYTQTDDIAFEFKRTLMEANGLGAQAFDIPQNESSVLLGEKGTIVRVPANCFKHSDYPVEIKMIEAPEISDMLMLGLPTVHDGKMLKTDGVVYVQAFSNGKEIKPLKELEIKVEKRNPNERMKAWRAEMDANGRPNWQPANILEIDERTEDNKVVREGMIEIPFYFFPYKAAYYHCDSIAQANPVVNDTVWAKDRSALIHPNKAQFYKRMVDLFETEEYAGTNLATREFAERLYRLQYLNHAFFPTLPDANGRYYLAFDAFAEVLDQAVAIYVKHRNDDLYKADLEVYELVKNYHPEMPANVQADYIPLYRDECDKQAEHFNRFAKEQMKKVIEIKNLGVNLMTDSAQERLVAKGMSPEKAREQLILFNKQQQVIASLRKDGEEFMQELKTRENMLRRERAANELRYYVITGTDLGWINIDQLFAVPNAEEFDFALEVKNPELTNETTQVYMVFKERKTVIGGYMQDDGRFHFTQDIENKTKLPMGEEVTLVAINISVDGCQMATKPIVIGEQLNEKIQLQACAPNELKNRLAQLDKEEIEV